eukprot:368328-Prymnesium_polylepis.2
MLDQRTVRHLGSNRRDSTAARAPPRQRLVAWPCSCRSSMSAQLARQRADSMNGPQAPCTETCTGVRLSARR